MSESMIQVVETLDPITKRILPSQIDTGTLVPLKTTLELRDNLSLGHAYITRAPTRLTNDVVTVARNLVGGEDAKNMPHLRRCCKPADLPAHLKAQFMNSDNGRAVHAGKSHWLYIMLGFKDELDYGELIRGLSTIDGIRDDIFVGVIPVPLRAPTSQVQANLWSQQFWQTVYRKNNPLGPHPSSICRTTTTVSRDAHVWMALAHKIAKQTSEEGYGEPIGAVIIRRSVPGKPDSRGFRDDAGEFEVQASARDSSAKAEADHGLGNANNEDPNSTDRAIGTNNDNNINQVPNTPQEEQKERTSIVAVAGDARWHQQRKAGASGNPMAHAALRAISMVAQKLVRAEGKDQVEFRPIEFESFQDCALLKDEAEVFEADHPNPDGYLCHDLELYMTHEPCTMCAMAILHSRMGRIIFCQRMPLTGGMSSEDRGYDTCRGCEDEPCGGGAGLGLHWRKELNWSMLGWEWEADKAIGLRVDPHTHA
ncbi:tRNA-specific adenosine deaminase 3 [Microdochium nivale]|nr:tRNA-specific adenosine deaminase 3 [Microdochium nivale]